MNAFKSNQQANQRSRSPNTLTSVQKASDQQKQTKAPPTPNFRSSNVSEISLATPGSHAAEKQAEHIGSQIGAQLSSSSSTGTGTLSNDIRHVAEPHLGISLANTQLATDKSAKKKTDQHQAKAVTEGSTIHFDHKRLDTSTSEGRTLLGHELTHVAQQRQAGVSLPQCDKDPTKQISRDDFKAHLNGKSLDVAKLSADPRLKGVDVSKADTDSNGQISTADEFNELFTLLDNLDRDGNVDTMASRDRDGSGNSVAVAMAAIGEMVGVSALTQPLQDAIDSRGFTDGIGHVATRSVNTREVRALRGVSRVTQINDPNDSESLSVGSTTYDFTVDADRKAFVTTLGLSPEMTDKLVEVIKNAQSTVKGSRSELAQIIRMWAPAERGETIPSRLVLSGHSLGGGDVWGNQGEVYRDDIRAIAEIMHNAAKLIEDIHVAACYCGGQTDVMEWLGIFPNLKTVWAYTGSGPTSDGGAPAHLVKWAAQTRGRRTDFPRSAISSKDSSAWTVGGGYKSSDPPKPLADTRKKVTDGEPLFQEYFKGNQVDASTSSGPLRSYYIDLQNLLQHPDLPKAERPALEQRRDTTILLIYYKKAIRKRFGKEHASAIDSGYKSLKLSVPDFATLSRADALAAIKRFSDTLAATDPQPQAALNLEPHLKAFAALDASKVPVSWI